MLLVVLQVYFWERNIVIVEFIHGNPSLVFIECAMEVTLLQLHQLGSTPTMCAMEVALIVFEDMTYRDLVCLSSLLGSTNASGTFKWFLCKLLARLVPTLDFFINAMPLMCLASLTSNSRNCLSWNVVVPMGSSLCEDVHHLFEEMLHMTVLPRHILIVRLVDYEVYWKIYAWFLVLLVRNSTYAILCQLGIDMVVHLVVLMWSLDAINVFLLADSWLYEICDAMTPCVYVLQRLRQKRIRLATFEGVILQHGIFTSALEPPFNNPHLK
ncbi:hypothetical protein Scep_004408 [Stephania cephalantha]|uniref:Uncharacterized protein n=1 Tax=Stephania cephalantha TaxID=152367 RepID=A0AAP0KU15_9MAGN